MIVFDHAFNANEWSVYAGLSIGVLLVLFLPKRFALKGSLVFFMCGTYSGFFFDNSLTINPFEFYEVNDSSAFQVLDYFLYLAYGPFSYLFFYGWDYLGLKSKAFPIYIFLWACVVLGLEWFGRLNGVYHYLNGYKIAYSFPIYLAVFSLWGLLYRYYKTLIAKEKR